MCCFPFVGFVRKKCTAYIHVYICNYKFCADSKDMFLFDCTFVYKKKNSDYIVALYHLLQVLHVKSDKTSIQLFRKKYNVSKRNVTLTWGLETTREFELYFTFYYTVQIRTIMNSISLRLDPISLSQNKHAFWTV